MEKRTAHGRGRDCWRRGCAATSLAALILLTYPSLEARAEAGAAQDSRTAVSIDATGAVRLPVQTVPFSSFASPEAKAAFIEDAEYSTRTQWLKQFFGPEQRSIAEQRALFAARFAPALKRTQAKYATVTRPETIGGIYTDVFEPRDGIAARNQKRVLINLHGGGFTWGARLMGALESIPVASIGRIKVIAIDYRQGPEHKFPAASQDVVAVYRELLKTYEPRRIGIYGCSAGGLLTAEATAWINHEHLPRPGAIGIFCSSAGGWGRGDSSFLAGPLNGNGAPADAAPAPHPEVSDAPYFSGADFGDPLVLPIRSSVTLGKFPPTLILTSTRDMAMSAAIHTHAELTRLGVRAELHVWDGLGHGFFTTNPDFPETTEAWDVVVHFFEQNL